jgi:hypothetical protein
MFKVCYCNDCLHSRSSKKRLPFTSGSNIFITGNLLVPHDLSFNDHDQASPNCSFSEHQSSNRSATQTMSHSVSDNFILHTRVCNRRSTPPGGGTTLRKTGDGSPLRRAGSMRISRTVGSLSNVSVKIRGESGLRTPPSYHSPRSYSNIIVITISFIVL